MPPRLQPMRLTGWPFDSQIVAYWVGRRLPGRHAAYNRRGAVQVRAQSPAVGAIAQAAQEPAQRDSRQIATAETGQNEHGMTVTSRRIGTGSARSRWRVVATSTPSEQHDRRAVSSPARTPRVRADPGRPCRAGSPSSVRSSRGPGFGRLSAWLDKFAISSELEPGEQVRPPGRNTAACDDDAARRTTPRGERRRQRRARTRADARLGNRNSPEIGSKRGKPPAPVRCPERSRDVAGRSSGSPIRHWSGPSSRAPTMSPPRSTGGRRRAPLRMLANRHTTGLEELMRCSATLRPLGVGDRRVE